MSCFTYTLDAPMQGKQAKILNAKQEAALLRHLETTRYPGRDTAMFLLSVKAGLRAKEIASLTWSMVTDAEGQVGDTMHLENRATKSGKDSGHGAWWPPRQSHYDSP